MMTRYVVGSLVLLLLLVVSPAAAQAPVGWEPFTGPPGGTVSSLAKLAGGTLFAASRIGLYERAPGADSWTRMMLPQAGVQPAEVLAPLGEYLVVQADTLLWRSFDRGQTWQPLREGLPSPLRIHDVRLGGDGTTYLGTDAGLYALSPRAASWRHVAFDEAVWQVAPFPDGSVLVLRDTTNINAPRALFRSEDLAEWRYVVIDDAELVAPGLLAVTSEGVAFAHELEPIPVDEDAPSGLQPAEADSFLWRSTDGGRTWERAPGQITGVEELIAGPEGSIYARTWNDVSYRSTDEGASWQEIPEMIYGVAGSGSDLYAGVARQGVLRSTDGGATWTDYATGLGSAFVNRIACSSSATMCYAAGYATYRTRDRGASWERLPPISSVHRWGTQILEVGPSDAVYSAPANPGGLYRSEDEGETWAQVLPDSAALVRGLALSGDTVIAAAYDTLYRSADGGATWTARSVPSGTMGMTRTPAGVLYLSSAADWGLHRSRDGGETWSKVRTWERWLPPLVASSRRGTVFTGTREHGYFRSEDEGASWEPMVIGETSSRAAVWSMTLNEVGVLFLGRSGPAPLYRSLDDGRTWQRADSGLSELPDLSAAYDLALDAEGYLYAALLDHGVARTTGSTGVSAETPGGPAYAETRLKPPFPNPAGGDVSVSYVLADPGHAHLTLYDLVGRRVRILASRRHGPGDYEVRFNAAGLAPGTYFVRLRTPGGAWTQAITVVR